MTQAGVLDWLAQREGASPEALSRRVREIVAAVTGTVGAAAPGDAVPSDAMVRATGEVLDRLLREQETARESALELLAADALATYAMEALGDTPELLEARCERAMRFFAERADAV